jgi:hypothetical protein
MLDTCISSSKKSIIIPIQRFAFVAFPTKIAYLRCLCQLNNWALLNFKKLFWILVRDKKTHFGLRNNTSDSKKESKGKSVVGGIAGTTKCQGLARWQSNERQAVQDNESCFCIRGIHMHVVLINCRKVEFEACFQMEV